MADRGTTVDAIDASEEFHLLAGSVEVNSSNTWHIHSGVTYSVEDITVNGRLQLDGELFVFGKINGSGTITGSGASHLVS